MSKALWIGVQTGLPIIWWGPPGVGKSSQVEAFGRAMDLHVRTVIASIREPADFAGLPVVHQNPWAGLASALQADKVTSAAAPPWLRSLAKNMVEQQAASLHAGVSYAPPEWALDLTERGKGILFLDEISTAPPATQSALLRLVLDKVIEWLRLPDAVWIVAAANPPEQAAGGWALSPPLANRFCHLNFAPSSEAWVDGMIRSFPDPVVARLPEHWAKGIPGARSLFASYIRHRPDKLLVVPKDDTDSGRAWPSPRTWTMAATMYAACQSVGADDDTMLELVSGCVGQGQAMEWFTWRQNANLPNPEDLLRDPKLFRVGTRADITFAILASVVAAALQDLTAARWTAAWKVLHEAYKQKQPDIAAAAAISLVLSRKTDFPVPTEEARAFLPLLQAAKNA